ncbi:MAG: cupin domain-containing protein [Actinomycetota bacterium]
MEAYPGVFVANASADEWQPDPDVSGSQMHELVHADGVWAGLSRFTSVDGPVTWTPEKREVAIILEGSVRIELGDGDPLELGVGDLFSLPPGLETTWHITTPFKEMWVLASDA